jgi:ribosomal protein L11 methyltransferase
LIPPGFAVQTLDFFMHVWSKLSSSLWADAWQERLGGVVGVQVVITEVTGKKSVRVEAFCELEAVANTIKSAFGGSVRPVKMENWAAMAPPPSDPIEVRRTLVICDADIEKKRAAVAKAYPGREIVAIPPELAFGTGHHATTSTVLGLVADQAAKFKKAKQTWDICDLGCGSGILAIAARKLGASRAWGCDFDPLAVKVAKENIERNGVDRVTLVKADVLKWKPSKQWDCVAANIFYDVLIAVFPTIVSAVKPDGVIWVSGILKTYADDCLAAGEAAGIHWEKRLVKAGKWVTAQGRLVKA